MIIVKLLQACNYINWTIINLIMETRFMQWNNCYIIRVYWICHNIFNVFNYKSSHVHDGFSRRMQEQALKSRARYIIKFVFSAIRSRVRIEKRASHSFANYF